MTDNYLPDWNTELLALAQLERATRTRIATAQAMRDAFYDAYVRHYDDEIAALNATLAEAETRLRQTIKDYAIETGDKNIHPNIEVRRKPKAWDYDPDTVLQVARAEGLNDLIRTKEELNRVKLNEALKDGRYPFLPVREAAPEMTVSIRPLGDLLIIAEAGLPNGQPSSKTEVIPSAEQPA